MKSGYGKMVLANGVKCEGEFSNNMMNGNGKLETTNFTYEGTFVNGNLHGKGRIVYKSGEQFEGRFDNN